MDPNGTAAQYDIIYHYVTFAFGYAVFTAITLGGYIFGFVFLKIGDPLECDFTAVADETKNEVTALLNTITGEENCTEVLK